MAVVDIKNLEGKNVGQIELPDDVFGAKVNPHLLHETVRWYQAAQRAGTHKTKGRGEVSRLGHESSGSRRARAARASARSAARSGARAARSTARVPRSYAYRLPRKMVLGALRSALSAKAGGREADGGGCLAARVAQDQAVSPGARRKLDGETRTMLLVEIAANRNLELRQPQSRRREAGGAARAAALRPAAARPPDALEGRGACAWRTTLGLGTERSAGGGRRDDRSGCGEARRGAKAASKPAAKEKAAPAKKAAAKKPRGKSQGQEVSPEAKPKDEAKE